MINNDLNYTIFHEKSIVLHNTSEQHNRHILTKKKYSMVCIV